MIIAAIAALDHGMSTTPLVLGIQLAQTNSVTKHVSTGSETHLKHDAPDTKSIEPCDLNPTQPSPSPYGSILRS